MPTIRNVGHTRPVRKLPRLALIAMSAGVLVAVTNASMSAIVLPDLQAEFGVSDDVLSWFVAAFLVPFATGTLVYGRLADMYGTKGLLVFGVGLFSVASFLVAAAPSFELAVAARVLQGMGATAIPALSMATIVHTTDERVRGYAFGTIVVAVGVGFGIGPLAGGSLTEWIGWQGPFLATGIATIVLLPGMIYAIPRVAGKAGQRFDAIGATLLSLAVTGGVVAINRLPNDPLDVYGLAGAVALAPLLGLFGLRTRTAREPFIDPAVLKNVRFAVLCVVGLCIQGAHFAVVVMLPLLLERYHDMRIVDIGFLLLPGALVLAVSGVTAGALAARTGPRPLLIGGTWILFNAAVIFVLAGAGWGPAGIAIVYVLVAAGYGSVNAVVIHAATGRLPADRTGVGVGVFNIAFFLGGAISVAAIGAILRMREHASEPWIGLFEGVPFEFSDAGLVVAGLATVAFLLTLVVGGEERADKDEDAKAREGPGRERWLERQKPNRGF